MVEWNSGLNVETVTIVYCDLGSQLQVNLESKNNENLLPIITSRSLHLMQLQERETSFLFLKLNGRLHDTLCIRKRLEFFKTDITRKSFYKKLNVIR